MSRITWNLNLSIGGFFAGLAIGGVGFFESYLDWLNLGVTLFSHLVFFFLTIYIFSSISIGIRELIQTPGFYAVLVKLAVTFVSVSLVFIYGLVVGLGYAIEVLSFNVLDSLTPSMLEDMALANDTGVHLKEFAQVIRAVDQPESSVQMLNSLFSNMSDQAIMLLGAIVIFSAAFARQALASETFSLSDCIDETYQATEAALTGLLRLLPVVAFMLGVATVLNLTLSFPLASLLQWSGLLVLVVFFVVTLVAVGLAVLVKTPFLAVVGRLGQVCFSAMASPSIFLMLPVIQDLLSRHFGIARERVQLLAPSTLLLANMSMVLSFVVLLTLTLALGDETARTAREILSPASIVLEQMRLLSFGLEDPVADFAGRLKADFGLLPGMYIPLILALLPMVLVLARPLAIVFVSIVVITVAKWSGDAMETEEAEVLSNETLIVFDISITMLVGMVTLACVLTLIVFGLGYGLSVAGIFPLN